MAIETQIRDAIKDAVNRTSRKPFDWGGLRGFQQLEAIGKVLRSIPHNESDTQYLSMLSICVEQALNNSRVVAQDLEQAHKWLLRIADCLRYPDTASSDTDAIINEGQPEELPITSQQVRSQMEQLLQRFQPDRSLEPAQLALRNKLHRLWSKYGTELLHCYDIPGLPPDNLKMEAMFGRLRRHQRRVSGRKSTKELRSFGQYQILFAAQTHEHLLEQLQQVPMEEYKAHRHKLAQAEAPRQYRSRLHRDPDATILSLLNQHRDFRHQTKSNTVSA